MNLVCLLLGHKDVWHLDGLGNKTCLRCWRKVRIRKVNQQYPEHEKLAALDEREQGTVQDFIDWLYDSQHLWVAEYDRFDMLMPVNRNREQLMADYFDIDLKELSREKDLMYRALVDRNKLREDLAIAATDLGEWHPDKEYESESA